MLSHLHVLLAIVGLRLLTTEFQTAPGALLSNALLIVGLRLLRTAFKTASCAMLSALPSVLLR